MSLQYKKGDIIDALKSGEITYLMHQANCEGNMGKGVAKSIAHHFPKSEKEYLSVLNTYKKYHSEFGSYIFTSDNIINVLTQYYKGMPNNKLFNYYGFETADSFNNRTKALRLVVEKISLLLPSNVIIGIPLIASGLAADKTRKEKFIKPLSKQNPDLLYFKEYIEPIFDSYDNFICYYL